jgi:Uncharacterized protein conserved in bacteria (DUF2272)
MQLRHWVIASGLLCSGLCDAADSCRQPGTPNPLGMDIAQIAEREYREFNGHRINADGYLWKYGSAESESELLYDPDTGHSAADRPGRFAWRRVWEYWLTLDRHVDGEALSRKVIMVPDLLENPETAERTQEIDLRTLFAHLKNDDPNTATALREAAVRAALNDSAWSAAFISYVMDRAHMSNSQFRYAAAHWVYIKDAFAASDAYAYRACDPHKTAPKAGDLLCYSRSRQPLKNFTEWQQAIQNPKFSRASHCDVVIAVDHHAQKMEAIGGNVMQSVAWRTLKLNQAGLLSDSYNPDRHPGKRGNACRHDKTCDADNLNVQYWSILLQLK